MFELLTLFLTGGGSAALGSILKGVFGIIADNRQQKFELELAREARGNEFALKFQEQLNNGDGGAFTSATRRMLALIRLDNLSAVVIQQFSHPPTRHPQQILRGRKNRVSFWDSSLFQTSKANLVVTTGHLCLFHISL